MYIRKCYCSFDIIIYLVNVVKIQISKTGVILFLFLNYVNSTLCTE
jgi:hypothetical protein